MWVGGVKACIYRVDKIIVSSVAYASNGNQERACAPIISAVPVDSECSCLNVADGGRNGVLPSAACDGRKHET